MTRTPPHQSVPLWRRGMALALVVSLQCQPLSQAWAADAAPTAPAQNPLISQGNVVPPNMMVTLDTSWSMIFPYMPEGDVKLAGGTVAFPGFTSVIMHPDDTRYAVDQGRAKGDGGAIPGDPGATATVFQMQMRSPDVNSLYYDPAITYKPWITAEKDVSSGDYKRYPNASASRAVFDPTQPLGAYANLTLVEASKSATWCPNGPAGSGNKLTCTTSSLPFNPGLYYRLDGANATCPKVAGAPNPNDTRCYTKFDVNSGGSFKKYATRTDCDAGGCTATQEQQNFANWFVYYRTRLHIAQASLPDTFLQLKDKKIRTGWATIHQGASTIDGASTRNVVNGVRTMDTPRKQELVNWIRSIHSDNTVSDATADPKLRGGTPLLSAMTGVGDYFLRTDSQSPWANDPSVGGSVLKNALSCRRSYNLLITDGYYTDSGSSPKSTVGSTTTTIANEDNTAGTLIKNSDGSKSYQYKPINPYKDDCGGTLADVAMYYWKSDLSTDLDNNIQEGKDTLTQDPAFWQHLTQFTVGLGVSGNINVNDLNAQLSKLSTGELLWWPSAANPSVSSCRVSGNDPKLVDDLLHAAVNSRGQYFSVKTSTQLTTALTTALSRAGRQNGMTQSGVSLQTLYIDKTNVKYVPEFTSEAWTGDVKAFESTVDASGTVKWSTTATWSASDKLPAAADRNIVTWNGSSGAKFQAGSVGKINETTLAANLPEGATTDQVIDFIRGDTSNEDTPQTLKLFRQRDSLIGDIVNSTPTLLKANVDLLYDKLPSSYAGAGLYLSFLSTKAARPPLLVVGANDGMLHAFADYPNLPKDPDDALNKSKARGQEVFAYVPQGAMTGLGNLARRDYGSAGNPHRFFVDGPLTESDAFLIDGWHNLLIGTMGAGGRSIFALDVTPGRTLDTSAVLWEKSATDDTDFGYMLGDAQVGMLPNGKWKVFVGNGPYSTNGHAVLMMIDLQDKSIEKIDVSAKSETGNGLGAVQLLKDANQQVVGLYAGDLLGRMWRFDVTPEGQVGVGLGGQPLFQTDKGQPITAAPSLISHALGGYMVLFGTGKLFDETDPDDTTQQTLYGVWDAPEGAVSGMSTSNLTKADLVEQKILPVAVATNARGQSFFDIEFNKVDYKTKRGWFIDLTIAPGQRLIYPTTPFDGDYVLMNTVVPAKTSDTPSCSTANGVGFTFFLPAFMDGRYTKVQTIDTNGDGIVNSADTIASVYSTPADGRSKVTRDALDDPRKPPVKPPCGQTTNEAFDNHVSMSQAFKKPPSGACSKINSRIWRQILNPPTP